MTDYINVKKKASEIEVFVKSVRDWAIQAGRMSIKIVRDQVRNLTPVWKGNLREGIQIREEEGGMYQVVYSDGVVAKVMEHNAQWTKPPPYKAILTWVEGKLFLTGKEATKAAFAIRSKIFKRGVSLPNRQGLGQMYQRTQNQMKATGLWYHTFKAALRALCRR